MSSTNLYEISSPSQFQELLAADLNRVSLINFWAPWAAPCKQMNEVVEELAKRYPTALFLQVQNQHVSFILIVGSYSFLLPVGGS